MVAFIKSSAYALFIKSIIYFNIPAYMDTVATVANVLGQVTMCSSVLMIVAFTFERHFAIRSPHQYRYISGIKGERKSLWAII